MRSIALRAFCAVACGICVIFDLSRAAAEVPQAEAAGLLTPANTEVARVIWKRQAGTTADEGAAGAATDAAGNVFLAGSTFGVLVGSQRGGSDAFIVKYDAAGKRLWTRQLGTPDFDFVNGVASDTAGNVVIVGETNGSLGGPNGGSTDAFLAKYDATGNLLWTRQFGISDAESASAVAIDLAGNVAIAGRTTDRFGDSDGFVAKYDASGNPLWTRQVRTDFYDEAFGVATDAASNVVVAGETYGSLGGPYLAGGDAFVVKYDAGGRRLWGRQFGTADDDGVDRAYGVAIDAAGNVMIAGLIDTALGTGPIFGLAAFVTKYGADGDHVWTRYLQGDGSCVARGVATDAAGNVVVAGLTDGSLARPFRGGDDGFVAKYDADGGHRWTSQFGANSDDYASGVAVDADGDIVTAGTTTGVFGGPHRGGNDAFLIKFRP